MSDQNEMKPGENQEDQNQEQEVEILAPTPCCSGCIIVDPANGCSVAEGQATTASGFAAHAEGQTTEASGNRAHAEGFSTRAIGLNSHAEGEETRAEGRGSHAEGGPVRNAQGIVLGRTIAQGDFSHAEGFVTSAIGFASHTEGANTTASGDASHAEGQQTIAQGNSSHSEGENTIAFGRASHAEGTGTFSSGGASHAEGSQTIASGGISHAEGEQTKAEGSHSHAEGLFSIASGDISHAEGSDTIASGFISHAEGDRTKSEGRASHAEGLGTTASGEASHAEGQGTVASGDFSHAEGQGTVASGGRSHAEGLNTSTNGIVGAHIMGRYGDAVNTYSWHLANGTSETNRSLAAKIVNDGRGLADRGWFTGNADYAEMFETIDGKPMDVGYFVTLDGEKIRKANKKDNYILGIVSVDPAILGDSGELRWKDKYVTDEWGRVQYHDVVIPAEKDQDGNVMVPEHTEKQPILNPDWDDRKEYIPRSERPEWVAVGLLGKLRVRDDGTCQVNGYCRPNNEGIATASDKGYRVMKRTGPNQILVLFNGNRMT